tara:strand:+ start:299 stop:637 length:339 start_codon:yes stop_codon:yes gene_type:complete
MPTRYDYRTIFFNQEPIYDTLFEERHVKGIRHYGTPRLKYPTAKEMQKLAKKGHVWAVGDRFYKLSIENYGSAQYWWIIAMFNQLPTDTDVQVGTLIQVPLPLEKALRMLSA